MSFCAGRIASSKSMQIKSAPAFSALSKRSGRLPGTNSKVRHSGSGDFMIIVLTFLVAEAIMQ